MSRGAGAPRSGDATASREPGPRAAGMRPSASRSRPPERILFVVTTLLPFVTKLRKGLPVATGELPQATDGMVSGYYPTLWRWQA